MLSLSIQGANVIAALRDHVANVDVYLHADVEGFPGCTRFDRVTDLVPTIFHQYNALIFVMPCGVIIRALAGLPRDKHSDPAVVMLDVGGRYAVSLLSGHEGGANDLALEFIEQQVAEYPDRLFYRQLQFHIYQRLGMRREAASVLEAWELRTGERPPDMVEGLETMEQEALDREQQRIDKALEGRDGSP